MIKTIPALILSLLLPLACSAEDAQFISMAKLLVGGADVNPKLENGEPIPDTFYATNIELIRSADLLKRALVRLHALHPELAPTPCAVEAARLPGTHIIVLRATAPIATFAQRYLDAVVDEFIAARAELRAGGNEARIINLLDEIEKMEKEIPLAEQRIKAAEQSAAKVEELIEPKAKLQQMKMVYERHTVTLRGLEKPNKSGEIFSILERATPATAVKPDVSVPNLFK